MKKTKKTTSVHPHDVSHQKQKKRLLLAIGLSIAVAALLGVFAYLLISNLPTRTNGDAKQKLQDILSSNSVQQKPILVESGFGFSVPYDASLFTSYAVVSNTAETREGYVSGESYTEEELAVKRNYTIVRLTSKEDIGLTESTAWLKPQLTLTTNFRKNYFDRSKLDAKYKEVSDLDVLLDLEKIKAAKNGDTVAKTEKITVGDQEFYKIILERTTANIDAEVKAYEYRYVTVNDSSPYWFSIGPTLRDESLQYVSIYESIISATKFSPHSDDSLVKTDSNAIFANASTDVDAGAIEQGYVDSADKVNLVARNQIATVRVGIIRCADLTLTASGKKFIAKNACNGGIGSGSIVSSDGYVVTNGHVVYVDDLQLLSSYTHKATNAQWQELYTYIQDSGIATREQILGYYNKSKSGDKDAMYTLLTLAMKSSKIQAVNDKKYVDIQTSDTPMRLDTTTTRWSWKQLAGNVTNGRVVDFEVNKGGGPFNINNTETDVAIIKVEGNYPNVKLGSLSTLAAGDDLTTLGFPAVVDDGTETTKLKTYPSVSQGSVIQIGKDGGNHLLAYSNAQIAAGNSGGPAFNDEGQQVAINTYGGSACDGNGGNLCFGNALSRDISDAKEMISKNNISIIDNGEYSKLWNDGIDSFLAADYEVASENFSDLNTKYPDNYLVEKLDEAAKNQLENAPITSSTTDYGDYETNNNTALVVVVVSGFILFVVITIGLTVVVVVSSKKHKAQQLPMQNFPQQPAVSQNVYTQPDVAQQPGETQPQSPLQEQPIQTQVYPTPNQQQHQPPAKEEPPTKPQQY